MGNALNYKGLRSVEARHTAGMARRRRLRDLSVTLQTQAADLDQCLVLIDAIEAPLRRRD